MALSLKTIYAGTLTNSYVTLYTSPTDTALTIADLSLFNKDTVADKIAYLKISDGVNTAFMGEFTIPPLATKKISGYILEEGYYIQAKADDSVSMDMILSGIVQSVSVPSGTGSLYALTDVSLSSILDGQYLGYNGSLNLWQNKTFTDNLVYTFLTIGG